MSEENSHLALEYSAEHATDGAVVLRQYGLANDTRLSIPTDLNTYDLNLSVRPHDVAAAWKQHTREASLDSSTMPDILVQNHKSGILWISEAGEIIRTNSAMESLFQKAYGTILKPLHPAYYENQVTTRRAEVDSIITQHGITKDTRSHLHVVDGSIAQQTRIEEILAEFDLTTGADDMNYATLKKITNSPTFKISKTQFGQLQEIRITEVFNPQRLLNFRISDHNTELQKSAQRLQAYHEKEHTTNTIPLPDSDIGQIANTAVDAVMFHPHPIAWIDLDTGKFMRINTTFVKAAEQACTQSLDGQSMRGSRALREITNAFHLSVPAETLQDELARYANDKELDPATVSNLLTGFKANTDHHSWNITARQEGRILELRFEPCVHTRTERSTIVFIDMVGSTEQQSRLGSMAVYSNLTKPFFDTLECIVTGSRGEVIKTIGDGAMLNFPDPVDAVRAISLVHAGLSNINANKSKDEQVRIRVGAHYGQSIVETRDGVRDLFGDQVSTTARLESAAAEKGEEGVAISPEMYDALGVREAIKSAGYTAQEVYKNLKSIGTTRVIFLTPANKTSNILPFK